MPGFGRRLPVWRVDGPGWALNERDILGLEGLCQATSQPAVWIGVQGRWEVVVGGSFVPDCFRAHDERIDSNLSCERTRVAEEQELTDPPACQLLRGRRCERCTNSRLDNHCLFLIVSVCSHEASVGNVGPG